MIESRCIRYSDGWKYRAEARVCLLTSIRGYAAKTPWVELRADGWLILEPGYCWDGPSGPAVDTPSFMRASAGHDGAHQLMRLGLIPQSCRESIDKDMRRWCREDGMWPLRVWYCWWAVRNFAAGAADPANNDPIRCAPAGDCCGHNVAAAVDLERVVGP